MSNKSITFLVILLYICLTNGIHGIRHYDGYSLIRLIPETKAQLIYLRQLEESVTELDFWKSPSQVSQSVDILIPPHLNHTFNFMFNKKSFKKSVLINDLEKVLVEERKPYIAEPNKQTKADIVVNHFDDYQRLNKIHSFLDAIANQYPDISATEVIGKSYENRDLKIIRIGVGQKNNNKPVIFFEGGIHAREWISPATVQFFAQTLIQGYASGDKDIKALLEKFDFYILPSVNPDGYEYTHTTSRLWRKTRQPYGSCYGADPNRNFGYKWGGEGASTNPCSDTYRGSKAFSEPETEAESKYILKLKPRVKAYFAVHSYGQYWLYPWGWTSSLTPDDKDLNRLGNIAITALAKRYNKKYSIGTSTNVLYAAAGGADDWAYGDGGIKYAYTVELRDTGSYGFTLPKSQIRPTGEETSDAFIAFAKQLSTENLHENSLEYDFWKGPSYLNRSVDVMVPPHLNQTFNEMFDEELDEKSVLINDLENNLLEDRAAVPVVQPLRADIVERHFDEYRRVGTIHTFLDTVGSKFKDLAAVEVIGYSYERRPIKLIRIGDGHEKKTKPVIFIESGIHAREWISPATSQCFAQNLIQGHKTGNADIVGLLQKFDFYILPVLNPDGYEYTHTRDRMWRKTRKPYGSCFGADPNRNFGYQWGGQGASSNPCMETYRGPNAFSESETKAVSDYVLQIKDRVKAYLAVHSYGQYWLYPWGWTSSVTPDDKHLNRMAKLATNALASVYGTRYTMGTSTNVLYAAAGGADDWAYGSAHIKYSYTVELRDKGNNGFALPKSHIRPTCDETTVAFIAFAKELAKEV
ncbi:zinc carboxypeptidase A 1-like [Oppia nitens]|uniref:zinc carboxypeptidase A 1-like n=1 Tax=Oppia nitens TaxID=1686743 RepID=UPI0023DBC524|nr:zinc carboxypeptidase A 1-like [Oppia nitens]